MMFEVRDKEDGNVVLAIRAQDVRAIGRGTATEVPVDDAGNRIPPGARAPAGSQIMLVPRCRVDYCTNHSWGSVETEEVVESLTARHEAALLEEQSEMFFSDEEADDIRDALHLKHALRMAADPRGMLCEDPDPDENELDRHQLVVEALRDLRACQKNKDFEMAHQEADVVLCRVLRALGWWAIVDEWVKVRRVYA